MGEYELVISGIVPRSTSAVRARSGRASSVAAVFRPDPSLVRIPDAGPFSLFVLEMPLNAACGSITIVADRHETIRRTNRRPRPCERARD